MLLWTVVPAGFGSLYFLLRCLARHGRLPAARPYAVLLGAVGTGVFVVTTSELASVFGCFRRPVIAAAWVALSLAACGAAFRLWRSAPRPLPVEDREPDLFSRNLRVLTFGSWALLLLPGLLLPQTNFDVVTYHLPRAMAWLQQGSLAPFPTLDYRQLDFAPFGSMAVAQLYALAGGDALSGTVQWAALGGCLVAAGLLVRLIVAGLPCVENPSRAEAVAQAFSLTIPAGILQATTCQNDLTAGFWLVTAVGLGAGALKEEGNGLLVAGAAGALSLAALSKETSLFFGAPFVAVFALMMFRRGRTAGSRVSWTVPIILAFALLHAGHLGRKWAVFGSPLGSNLARETLLSKDRSPSAVASSVLRNVSLYSATGVPFLTGALNDVLTTAHRWTGRDPNDPATTYGGARFRPQVAVRVDDSFVNLPSSLAVVLLAGVLLFRLDRGSRERIGIWGLLVLAGGLIFCALVRWQVFNVRFHLVGFLLLAPAVGVVLSQSLRRAALGAVVSGLFLAAGYAVATNETRTLVPWDQLLSLPRERQAFVATPDLYPDYRLLVDAIQLVGCRDVGLALSFLEPEYHLWSLAGGPSGPIRFRYVGPDSLVPVREEKPPPCAVVTSERAMPDASLGYIPGLQRRSQLDRSRFGSMRLFLDPSTSGGHFLLTGAPAQRVVLLEAGERISAGPNSSSYVLWTFRPGAAELSFSAEGASPGDVLYVRDGRGGRVEASASAGTVVYRNPLPGGPWPLVAGLRSGTPGARLRVEEVRFEPATDTWCAVRVDGLVQASGSESGFEVGVVPKRLDLVSRWGGAMRVTARLVPVGEGGPNSSLVAEWPGGREVFGVPGRLVLTVRTGADVLSLRLRAGAEAVSVENLAVMMTDEGAPSSNPASPSR